MESTALGFLVAVVAALAFGLGIAVDRFLLKRVGLSQLTDARLEAKRLIADAEREIDAVHEQRIARAEDDLSRREESFKEETAETRKNLKRLRQKLDQGQEKLHRRTLRVNEREDILHNVSDTLETLKLEAEQSHRQSKELEVEAGKLREYARKQRHVVDEREARLEQQREKLESKQQRLDEMIDDHVRKLEQVSGLSKTEAGQVLLEKITEQVKLEASSHVKEIRDEAKLHAAREARKVVLTAIQRTAAGHTIDNTVSVVHIASDEMKGRIIGREGRNIRAFEASTGIDVIVDDTPETVILSGFNPVRREIARIALTRLTQDGRIHPARIEEVVEKSRLEIEEEIIELG